MIIEYLEQTFMHLLSAHRATVIVINKFVFLLRRTLCAAIGDSPATAALLRNKNYDFPFGEMTKWKSRPSDVMNEWA